MVHRMAHTASLLAHGLVHAETAWCQPSPDDEGEDIMTAQQLRRHDDQAALAPA
jgi:hypothetical protein